MFLMSMTSLFSLSSTAIFESSSSGPFEHNLCNQKDLLVDQVLVQSLVVRGKRPSTSESWSLLVEFVLPHRIILFVTRNLLLWNNFILLRLLLRRFRFHVINFFKAQLNLWLHWNFGVRLARRSINCLAHIGNFARKGTFLFQIFRKIA